MQFEQTSFQNSSTESSADNFNIESQTKNSTSPPHLTLLIFTTLGHKMVDAPWLVPYILTAVNLVTLTCLVQFTAWWLITISHCVNSTTYLVVALATIVKPINEVITARLGTNNLYT